MQSYDISRRLLAMALALLAGFVDSTGFFATSGYFVSFMSGNTTRFSVDLATEAAQALLPALLIIGFVAGVTLGALAIRRAARWRKTVVIGLAVLLLGASAGGRAAGSETVFLAGMVLAMGAINNTFSRDREVAVGLTYMTGALVRFGQGLAARLCGEAREGWALNLALWASLALGAAAGALAAVEHPAAGPWISLALAVLLLASAYRIERARPGVQSS